MASSCTTSQVFEPLDKAREKIGGYIDRYQHRPHSGLAYRTPREVAATWKSSRRPVKSQRPD
jgi:putative transposase